MLRIVHNGCIPAVETRDDRTELRSQLQLDPDAFVLLTAAHMNACKGHKHLLNAMPAVLATQRRVRLVLLGTGPLEEDLRRQARSLGIESRVDFLGFRSDVRRWLRTADLFVLPSLAEGISAVLLEAMFEGCPIVATQVGGTPELLRSEESIADGMSRDERALAWVVPPADPAALATALLDALANPHARSQRTMRARQVAEADFTVETMVARTLAVYREVIEERENGDCRSAC